MRLLPLAVILSLSAGAFAQSPVTGVMRRTWTLGVQGFGPDLTGHAYGIQDGQAVYVDLQADLGLSRDTSKPGFFLDYQGPRFGFQVSTSQVEYLGDQVMTRTIIVDGTPFTAGTRVKSFVKTATVEGVWTIRILRGSQAWLGVDLGAQAWKLDLQADSAAAPPLPAQSESESLSAPIPEAGLSGGFHAFGDILEVKAFARYLPYQGATFTRLGAEARVYPISWLGIRAFYDATTFDVPKGSVQDDLEVRIDQKGAGIGIVVRF